MAGTQKNKLVGFVKDVAFIGLPILGTMMVYDKFLKNWWMNMGKNTQSVQAPGKPTTEDAA